MSLQRHIIPKYTALFTISLFPPSGTRKLGVSVVLPFPSSLLDAKLIYDHQPFILIPRITLRGLLGKEGNEWPTQLVPEHTKSVRLWKSKALMMFSKLPRELACSWETVYPANLTNTLHTITIKERVVGGEDRKRIKIGAVVLFAEKVCGILMHIPWSFRFSLPVYFLTVSNFVNISLDWCGSPYLIHLLIYHWFNYSTFQSIELVHYPCLSCCNCSLVWIFC